MISIQAQQDLSIDSLVSEINNVRNFNGMIRCLENICKYCVNAYNNPRLRDKINIFKSETKGVKGVATYYNNLKNKNGSLIDESNFMNVTKTIVELIRNAKNSRLTNLYVPLCDAFKRLSNIYNKFQNKVQKARTEYRYGEGYFDLTINEPRNINEKIMKNLKERNISVSTVGQENVNEIYNSLTKENKKIKDE